MDLDEATKAMAHGYELLSQLQKVGVFCTRLARAFFLAHNGPRLLLHPTALQTVPPLAEKIERLNQVMADLPRMQASRIEQLMVGNAGNPTTPAAATTPTAPPSSATRALAAQGLAILQQQQQKQQQGAP